MDRAEDRCTAVQHRKGGVGTNSLKIWNLGPNLFKESGLQNRHKIRAQYINKKSEKINILGPDFGGKQK